MQASEPVVVVAEGRRNGRFSPRVWTLIVLAIGLAIGIAFALLIRREFTNPGRSALFLETDYVDMVVTSVELSFLVSLLYIYNRTYLDTHARFALGVIVVLISLLFQAVLTYPVFYVVMNSSHLAGPLTLAADAAETVAFGVFLYLGLQ